MYKGYSRKRALETYQDKHQEGQALQATDVIEYVPATAVLEHPQGSVKASQIIHTQNNYNYHYPTNSRTDKPQTKKASSEEAALWLVGLVSVTFTLGFFLAVLIRG